MSDRECPYCYGDGGEQIKEGPHDVFDACYACGTTGRVSEQRFQQYRLECLVGMIAARMVDARRECINSNPDGEGWDFHAAENGMTGYEYGQVKYMEFQDRAAKEVRSIEPVILEDLKDRIQPDDPEKTLLFRTYTRKDFPGLSIEVTSALLDLLYPPRPSCSYCGPELETSAKTIVFNHKIEDDGSIPF